MKLFSWCQSAQYNKGLVNEGVSRSRFKEKKWSRGRFAGNGKYLIWHL